jgi:hypothetical protein
MARGQVHAAVCLANMPALIQTAHAGLGTEARALGTLRSSIGVVRVPLLLVQRMVSAPRPGPVNARLRFLADAPLHRQRRAGAVPAALLLVQCSARGILLPTCVLATLTVILPGTIRLGRMRDSVAALQQTQRTTRRPAVMKVLALSKQA